jgi:hypothetical protein
MLYFGNKLDNRLASRGSIVCLSQSRFFSRFEAVVTIGQPAELN